MQTNDYYRCCSTCAHAAEKKKNKKSKKTKDAKKETNGVTDKSDKEDKADKTEKTDKIEEKEDIEYAVGDKVEIKGKPNKPGQIKFIGETKEFGAGTTYYGIRLVEKKGNCDGEWKGKRCFRCPKNFGIYVTLRQIVNKVEGDFDFSNVESRN